MKAALDFDLKVLFRWFLGVILVWAAISKQANLQEFHGDLLAYQLPLPGAWLRLVAVSLPWLELFCGLMLLGNVRLLVALVWCVVLFGLFALATGQAWVRGLDISCGCFNLDFLGLKKGGTVDVLLHSGGFAFFRAVALGGISLFLLRECLRTAGRPPQALGPEA